MNDEGEGTRDEDETVGMQIVSLCSRTNALFSRIVHLIMQCSAGQTETTSESTNFRRN